MDNDEDEDGNFTKWMSSYWGHSTGDDRAKDRRRSFRRPSLPRPPQSRRSSLPCQSQLNAMQLNHLHTGTTASLPTHVKSRNKTEVKPHLHACRASSDDNSHVKSQPLSSRIDTIHELSESLERRLCFRSHNLMSLGKRPEWRLCGSGSSSSSGGGSAASTLCDGQKSRDAPSCAAHEDHRQTRRKLSLRRQR